MFEYDVRIVIFKDGKFANVVFDFKEEINERGLTLLSTILCTSSIFNSKSMLKILEEVIWGDKKYAASGAPERRLQIWKEKNKVRITDKLYKRYKNPDWPETFEMPATEFHRILKEYIAEYTKQKQIFDEQQKLKLEESQGRKSE